MNTFHPVNVSNFYKTRNIRTVFAKKYAEIFARKAIPGETIETRTANGILETVNTAKEDQWIVTGIHGENYILPEKTLFQKYTFKKETPQGSLFQPIGNPIECIPLGSDESISFCTPWGERMNILGEGILVKNSETDLYGIQKEEFEKTYTFCFQDGTLYSQNVYKCLKKIEYFQNIEKNNTFLKTIENPEISFSENSVSNDIFLTAKLFILKFQNFKIEEISYDFGKPMLLSGILNNKDHSLEILFHIHQDGSLVFKTYLKTSPEKQQDYCFKSFDTSFVDFINSFPLIKS